MKNKYFSPVVLVVAALFAGVLIGGTAYLLNAQTSNGTWQPPAQAFPNTNGVSAPIDVGNVGQNKAAYIGFTDTTTDSNTGKVIVLTGSLLKFQTNQGIGAPSTSFILSDSNNNTTLTSGGAFYISNSQGVVLPQFSGDPTTIPPRGGTIYFNTTNKTVRLNTNGTSGGWTDIGTGTGSSQWQTVASGIQYTGGDVTINNGGVRPAGWYYKPSLSIQNSTKPPTDANGNTIGKMSCDANPDTVDCVNDFYPPDTTGTPVTPGTKRYDSSKSLTANLLAKAVLYDYKVFEYAAATTGQNTASLNTANASVSGTATIGTVNASVVNGGSLQGTIIPTEFNFSNIKTVTHSPINGGFGGCTDLGVKGIVISFTANGGGSGGDGTSFWLEGSLPAQGSYFDSHGGFNGDNNLYTIFNNSNDVSYGGGNIKVCFPPSPFSPGNTRFLDTLTVNYIPIL